jgi:hypothetical protein
MKKFLVLLIMLFSTSYLYAESNTDEANSLREELKLLKSQFQEMKSSYENKISQLESKIEQITEKTTATEAKVEQVSQATQEPSQQALYSTKAGGTTLKLMDISFDSLFTAGGSTASESEIDKLQGGGHDPKKRGFTTQNLEFSMLGAVDPYFNAESHLIFHVDKDGESKLEVEEAFLTTQSLPYGLQVKAGHFFTEFGRLNPQHPHSWDFVDQPVINSRMFGGDGLRTPGARLSWLTPLPWYSEVLLGAQNANGETAFSFLNKEGEDFSGYTLIHREVHSAEDLLYLTRWLNSLNLSDEVTLNLGTSALFGPNASGVDNRTNIYGADIYLKWKPLVNDRGFPFIASQTEFMKRKYEAGEEKDNFNDYGLYTQLLWGFKKGWVAGLRYDFADGNGLSTDYLRDRRQRISPNLTWYPTEFSKIRLQYNYDRAQHISDDGKGDEHSIWLQYEFMLGAHPKHKF